MAQISVEAQEFEEKKARANLSAAKGWIDSTTLEINANGRVTCDSPTCPACRPDMTL